MTSFLIIGKDEAKRALAVEKLCDEQLIAKIDKTILQKDTSSKTSTQSIGIEEIKTMHKLLYFKPIKSKTKAVIIQDAHFLTPEAQNALLKVLEEPPDHTILILSSENKEAMLPTILSRCQLINLREDAQTLSAKESAAMTEFLQVLPTLTQGERLKKAEVIAKDKEKALSWTKHVIIALRDQLIQDPQTTDLVPVLKAFQNLNTMLKTTNVNVRFAIEQTLLSI